MATNHWSGINRYWSQLCTPMRPNDEVANGFATLIQEHAARVLLLGVTPELSGLGVELEAVDKNAGMLTHIWSGDTPSRRARLGDWTALPYPAAYFSAVIGDGSLTAINWPDDYARLFAEVRRVLVPGARFVLRLFLAPECPESAADLCKAAQAGSIRSFHAFKWRLAMALVAQRQELNIPVIHILDAFNTNFPDRNQLAARTAWSLDDINTIDAYRDSSATYSFPTLSQLRAKFSDVIEDIEIIPCGTYALSERCPLASVRLRAI